MRQRDDDDLRTRFAALRQAEASLDPGFASPRRPRERSPRTGGRLAALAAVAAGIAFALVVARDPSSTPGPEALARFAPERWAMPSDVLLDLAGLPGDALLHELPVFEALGTSPADAGPRRRPDTGARTPRARRPLG